MSKLDKFLYFFLVFLNVVVALCVVVVGGFVLSAALNLLGFPQIEVWHGVALVALFTFLGLPAFHAKDY
jgi:hypothetical protein